MELFIMILFGFSPEPLLFERARVRACEIRDNFSHAGIEKSLTDTNYELLGENLAVGYLNDYEIMKAFINSPKHLYNFQTDFKYFGVGRCEGYMAVILAK